MVLAAATAVTAVVVPGVVADADQAVECDGPFPIFHTLAQTEEENQARIACVEDRKDEHQASLAEKRKRKADLTERIQLLKERRGNVTTRIAREKLALAPLNEVTSILKFMIGDVSWTYSTAFCETGGTMDEDIHSDSGSYHGLGQFARHWGDDLDQFRRRGGGDPHSHFAIVQGAAMVELKQQGGDEQWPVCGD